MEIKDANKPFSIYMCFVIILGIIAGLCIKLKYLGASGIFTSITSILLILGLPWGFYPSPKNVRKRNIVRLCMFLFLFHVFVFGVIGTSESVVSALNVNNATKSIETFSKTYSTLVSIKDVVVSILKFESVNFEKVLWVYVVFFIGVSIAVFKLLLSWGWACVITAGFAIGALVCTWRFWGLLGMPWHWLGVAVVVFLAFLTVYFGKPYYRTPALA